MAKFITQMESGTTWPSQYRRPKVVASPSIARRSGRPIATTDPKARVSTFPTPRRPGHQLALEHRFLVDAVEVGPHRRLAGDVYLDAVRGIPAQRVDQVRRDVRRLVLARIEPHDGVSRLAVLAHETTIAGVEVGYDPRP